MNILFVNYGDFTTNSLNHIGGFANTLAAGGHSCAVAVPSGKDTSRHYPNPGFLPVTYAEALAPGVFPDGRPADVLHAWTPREGVRRFILEHQRQQPGTRVIIHLEDNEEHLLEAFGHRPVAELRDLPRQMYPFPLVDGLAHPVGWRHLLRLADAATVIVERLREHVPAELPTHVLTPGVDFGLYLPQAPDAAARQALGIGAGERVIVFTGSITFANAEEMTTLYEAVQQLNRGGIRTRLVRTGITHPEFAARLGFDPAPFTIELGFVEKTRLPGLLALADVLVQPGRPNAFNDYRLPSKVPEFLSMGKPVILPATNIGARLKHGREALLLRDGSADEIATACRQVFAQPELAARLGQAAVKFARQHFDLSTNTAGLLRFYDETRSRPARAAWTELAHAGHTELPLVVRQLSQQLGGSPAANTPPSPDELRKRLADIGRAIVQLGYDLEEKAGTVADLERHAAGLEATRAALQADIATVRAHADQHAQDLEGELAKAVGHSRELEKIQAALQNDIALVRAHAAEHARQLETEVQNLLARYHVLSTELEHTNTHRRQLEAALDESARDRRQFESTISALQQDVVEVRAHAAEHARQLEAAMQTLLGRQRDLQTELEHTSTHCRQLESTITTLRQDVVEVRQHAAKHARQLEAANEQLAADLKWLTGEAASRLQNARAVCELAEREVIRLQDALYESEYRVRRLQGTFSWRATAWLRALRRVIVDRVFGPPKPPPPPPRPERPVRFSIADLSLLPPAPTLHHNLDAPRQWPEEARELGIRGWVVSEAGPLTAVRARVGDRTFVGEYGHSRPDVGHHFPHLPGANAAGFRIVATLVPGDENIHLEAQDGHGRWHIFLSHPLGRDRQLHAPGSYAHWVKEFDTLTPETIASLRQQAEALATAPLISVLMPVYNTPERWLVRALESVRAQVYGRWELCVADDASTHSHVRPLLERYAKLDSRIKPVFRETNGHISAASNSALGVAAGAFCALMDHDDELPPHALLCVARLLSAHADAEVVYSDEDKIDEAGFRFDPHFKPDWNPDLLASQNYLSHLTVYRTDTLRAVGGFRVGFEGAQDWDLALRITDHVPAERIHHIPRVLYHWRAIEGSTAMQLQEKDYVVQAARRALEDHFARRQERVALHLTAGHHWHVQRPRPEPAPRVTLVIPTRNRKELLITCVESIFARTAYPNFEILIADNDSDDPELFAFYERRRAAGRFEVLPCPGPFNFSVINNHAVRHARGELVGLLNNDLETMHPEWLDELVAHAVRPEIGCVGAKLYYPDQRIQHAGVITGLGGVAGHPFKGYTRAEPGTAQFRPHLVQNLSAVTAACLVIRKSTYLQAGGLDETGLTVAFNDVDFCLKVQALGYRNLFTPFAELLHHESASRGAEDTPEKIRRFQQEIQVIQSRWGRQLLEDPAYNPNLTLASEDFGLAYPPRTPALVAD